MHHAVDGRRNIVGEMFVVSTDVTAVGEATADGKRIVKWRIN
jgi:hypothetical protein